MTIAPIKLQHRRIRAPENDGQVLQEPPLSEFESAHAQNRTRIQAYDFLIDGIPVGTLRSEGQKEAVRQAVLYSERYRQVTVSESDSIIMSGHQPQLFHPGVWFKNIVLSQKATAVGAIGINFIVDNDLGNSTRINVPTGTLQSPSIRSIAYDIARPYQPFEGRTVNEPEHWRSFQARVESTLEPLVENPLISRLWPIVEQLSATDRHSLQKRESGLGPEYAIAAGRHRIEQDHGLETLEIPLSTLCQSAVFSRFAAELFARANEFQSIHNVALDEYRTVNRIRSAAHPVPSLVTEEAWIEVPFWLWQSNRPFRRAAWLRKQAGRLILSNRNDVEVELSSTHLAESIDELASGGICLRPRALVTTMFSRLVLSDVFLHGIGGSKYDQITDVIVEKLFGVEAPGFFTLSSTNHLPVDLPNFDRDRVREIDQRIREFRYQGERHLLDNPSARLLVNQKQELLSAIPPERQRKSWQQQLDRINLELDQIHADAKAKCLDEKRKLLEAERINSVLRSREFSFCLFPESIVETLIGLAR